LLLTICNVHQAAPPAGWKIPADVRGGVMIDNYFRKETAALTQQTARRIAAVKTTADWVQLKKELRKELQEMLGLDPFPAKTDLKPVVTGKVEHAEFTVENIHFQSKPHLYVTGNLYLPKQRNKKLPAILYVCGHGGVKKNGVSYGNKVHYQHHGSWFSRNGYVCLTIDTLQLGEIEGMHHGTYKYNEWWWNARGYTSAGVEAWNCIRALDYLETRPEVDATRMGVTGRSGGGAYSWWVAALDDRIQAAVPVAGITSLHNHVVDGCVEGHCDCMFMVNTFRWDYPLLAALLAPRPLLISNSDKDRIFPLEGVIDIYTKVRPLYELHNVPRKLGLHITEGPQLDTQELRVHAFHWFNKFLKGEDPSPLIETTAVKFFEPEQLKVFDKIPTDEINTKIQQSFTLTANTPPVPESESTWKKMQSDWKQQLTKKSFRGWPDIATGTALNMKEIVSRSSKGVTLTHYTFQSQPTITLDLYLMHRDSLKPADLDLVVLNALDQPNWEEFVASAKVGFPKEFADEKTIPADKAAFEQEQKMFATFKWGMAYIAPRGIGPTQWSQTQRKQTQIRRRFMQLGQTQDSMRTWDIRRAVQSVRAIPGLQQTSLWMQGKRTMAGNVLYASLYEPNIKRLDLWNLPTSHHAGPIYLNVRRILDMPQAVAMAGSRSQVRIYQNNKQGWEFPQQVGSQLHWDKKQLQVRVVK